MAAGSTAYTYEAHGDLSRVTLRNGAYTDYSYDRGGRPTRLANYHSAYDDGKGVTRRLSTAFDYNYDDNGNITEIVQDFVGAEVVTDYAYDEINRLTREVTCDFMNQYYYDDGGNRTKLVHMNAVYSKDGNGRIVSMLTKASESNQGLTKTYLYANFTELTKMTASEYGGTTRDYTYEHDMAGRLTRQVQNVFSPDSTTTYNYEWDALDRMTKVQRVASGVTKTINYTYNVEGLRARRVDTSTNVTKLWTYQGDNIASVQTSSGGAYGSDDYVYTVGPGMINNVTERHKLNGTGSDSRYYQYDHRGNVVAVSDASGRILRGYQYDAFGNIPFSFATGQSGAAPTDDILFTGKDLDPDTNLYYFNARWYDPDLGCWIGRSYYGPDREHFYSFCDADPMGYVDPSGRKRRPGESRWDCFNRCTCEGVIGDRMVQIAVGAHVGLQRLAAVSGLVDFGEAGMVGSAGWRNAVTLARASGPAAIGVAVAPYEFKYVYCITTCQQVEGGWNPFEFMVTPPPPPTYSPHDCIEQCQHLAGTKTFSSCYKGCMNANPGP